MDPLATNNLIKLFDIFIYLFLYKLLRSTLGNISTEV